MSLVTDANILIDFDVVNLARLSQFLSEDPP